MDSSAGFSLSRESKVYSAKVDNDQLQKLQLDNNKSQKRPVDNKNEEFTKKKFETLNSKNQSQKKIEKKVTPSPELKKSKGGTKSNISESTSEFFQSASRGIIFEGHAKKIKQDKFIEKLESKEKKSGVKLDDHIDQLEIELADATLNPPSSKKSKKELKELNIEKTKQARRNKIQSFEKKGEEVRQQMEVLGAERVTMTTSDKVKLDGMYLDAKKFRKTLKDAGGKLVSYTVEVKAKDPKSTSESITLQGISLSKKAWEASGKQVLHALKTLHGVADNPNSANSHPGAGWTAVQDGENILLVRSECIPDYGSEQANNDTFFLYDKKTEMWKTRNLKPPKATVKVKSIDTKKEASGTVILSTGNRGIYEMDKDEALSYLFRNMNVMMFNFRGYGKSEGVPSEKGLKRDMESAYRLAKVKSGHPDNKILFKALCLSGGPAAYVASKHPETNIFLDQTYSSFKSAVKEAAKSTLVSKISESDPGKERVAEAVVSLLSPISSSVIDLTAPEFNTAKYLGKIKGKKAILFTHNDELISIKHVEKNLAAIAKVSQLQNTMIFSMPGEHGESILEAQSSRVDFLDKTLKKELISLQEKENEILKSPICKKPIFFKPNGEIESGIAELKLMFPDQYKKEVAAFKELKEIRAKLDVLLLPLGMTRRDLFNQERIGQKSMSHFLANAGLSEDIIQPLHVQASAKAVSKPLLLSSEEKQRFMRRISGLE